MNVRPIVTSLLPLDFLAVDPCGYAIRFFSCFDSFPTKNPPRLRLAMLRAGERSTAPACGAAEKDDGRAKTEDGDKIQAPEQNDATLAERGFDGSEARRDRNRSAV